MAIGDEGDWFSPSNNSAPSAGENAWPSANSLPPAVQSMAVERTGAQPGDRVLVIAPVPEDPSVAAETGIGAAFLRLRPND